MLDAANAAKTQLDDTFEGHHQLYSILSKFCNDHRNRIFRKHFRKSFVVIPALTRILAMLTLFLTFNSAVAFFAKFQMGG